MGGYSSDYEVSIRSGNEVYKNLSSFKYNLFKVIITKEKWYCIDKNENKYSINVKDFSVNKPKIEFDYVINVIHGSPGEDGLIQSYFKMLNIKHSSSEYFQTALTFNKSECKNFLIKHNILTRLNISKHFVKICNTKFYFFNFFEFFFVEIVGNFLKNNMFHFKIPKNIKFDLLGVKKHQKIVEMPFKNSHFSIICLPRW